MTTTDLMVVEQASPLTLFGTDNPKAIIASASEKAAALADVIREKGLSVTISNREYVKLEGWSLLGTMLGVFPVCVWSRRIGEDGGGWEARVEARTLNDQLVGAAEAQCCRDEATWKGRADFALRSMAQTRASSKALRIPLGFIMSLAGYSATPAEEMDYEQHSASSAPRPAAPTPIRDEPLPSGYGEDEEYLSDPELDERHGYSVVPSCQFCHGQVWDNRENKRNPKGPDYKCRDKQCDAAAWIQPDGSLSWKAGAR